MNLLPKGAESSVVFYAKETRLLRDEEVYPRRNVSGFLGKKLTMSQSQMTDEHFVSD